MGITFDMIKEANASIKTTDIKGKDYAEVNQRLKAFRMVFPEGTILTTMQQNEGGVCVFRAEVYDGDHLLGTGTAYEKESSSYINKTSYIENCETSAVGRALGMCGFGIDTSVASKEEVENAIAQQDAIKADEAKREGKKDAPKTDEQKDEAKREEIRKQTVTPAAAKAMTKRLEDAGIPIDYVCSLYKVERIDDMTEKMHANLHEHFNDVVKMFNEAQ